jgi:hypothetical protein
MMYSHKAHGGTSYLGYADTFARAVAWFNQTYFSSYNWFEVLCAMKYVPDGFIDMYKRIISAKSAASLKLDVPERYFPHYNRMPRACGGRGIVA